MSVAEKQPLSDKCSSRDENEAFCITAFVRAGTFRTNSCTDS